MGRLFKALLGFALKLAIAVLLGGLVYSALLGVGASFRPQYAWTPSAFALTPLYAGFLALAVAPIVILTRPLHHGRRLRLQAGVLAAGLVAFRIMEMPFPMAVGHWWNVVSCFLAGIVAFVVSNRLMRSRARHEDG